MKTPLVTGHGLCSLAAPVLSLALLAAAGCEAPEVDQAPLLEGMGAYHRPITTTVEAAQRYFNQGLILTYAFNHAEAARSFREAIRRDPECAMCAWGLALSLGPNINAPMDPADNAEAVRASRRAVELATNGTPAERALAEALSLRYREPAPDHRTELDRRYAEALSDVHGRFPEDHDVATLSADAWMNTMPWDYWTEDGEPRPATAQVLAALEGVLDRFPQHPGANHLYIHVVESVDPERGVEAAERLGSLVPGAGHLVHMPSHIFLRVGRYHDATLANERAIAADESYDAQCRAQGLYPLVYMPHNEHFLWASATAEGRSELALSAAYRLVAAVDPDRMREPGFGTLQHYSITPLLALVRFGRWGEILLTRQPDPDLVYPNGVWRYARAIALVRLDRLEEARVELGELSRIVDDPVLEEVTIWDLNTTADLVRIANQVAVAELAAAEGDLDEAILALRSGIEIEDSLRYDEPPPWHAPVRHTLGVVLLVSGRPDLAEAVYREDLRRHPETGWALFGLLQSLRLQSDHSGAAEAETRFQRAWKHADIELTASRM